MNKETKKLIMIFFIAFGLRLMLFLAIGAWREDVFEKGF